MRNKGGEKSYELFIKASHSLEINLGVYEAFWIRNAEDAGLDIYCVDSRFSLYLCI